MEVPWILTASYGLASVVAFALYGWDKRAARRRARRVPEARLHLAALLGGFPGAWLGRRLFHHKTLKPGFARVIGLAALLHAGLWTWWLWPD